MVDFYSWVTNYTEIGIIECEFSGNIYFCKKLEFLAAKLTAKGIKLRLALLMTSKHVRKKGFDTFDPNPFIRSFSYRDFLTSASLALMTVTIQAILSYYSSETGLNGIWYHLTLGAFVFIMPVNHIIYKLEHRRSNNFIGRAFHDAIFIGVYLAVVKTYGFIRGVIYQNNSSFEPATLILILIMAIIFVLLLEIVIGFVKRFFNLFHWQIF